MSDQRSADSVANESRSTRHRVVMRHPDKLAWFSGLWVIGCAVVTAVQGAAGMAVVMGIGGGWVLGICCGAVVRYDRPAENNARGPEQ